jgi:pimeloyl-ACP methyl ester carboxylesterase
LAAELVRDELQSFSETATFDALVRDLAAGQAQEGTSEGRATILIGWGRKDRLCLPRQAQRAALAFPNAKLHWFENSGHFPMWDEPEETVRLILGTVT